MSKIIDGLYYSESHEYVKVEGNFGYVGITDYAQHELGNVVYVDMPEVDDEVEAGEDFGAVESVKAASDLVCPPSLRSSWMQLPIRPSSRSNPPVMTQKPRSWSSTHTVCNQPLGFYY